MKKQMGRFTPETSPLGPALTRFARSLEESGYRKSTTDQYLSILRKFDGYVARRQVEVAALRVDHVEAFLVESTGRGQLREDGRLARRFWRGPLMLLLEQLRVDNAVVRADAPAKILGPGIAEYIAFLREHRGFCESTIARQRLHVGMFLTEVSAQTEDDLRRIKIDQIDHHLVQASRRFGRESIGSVCASLRGFLGHLHMRGILASDLREHVATPHIYPLAAMPRAVAWSEVERTLATIDRSTALGCRNYAMLALVAYGGLRAGDVAALRLEDLDWRRDTIHARRPKDDTTDDVPLVPALGEALIAYLRRRPTASHSEVFLTAKAPIAPVTGQRISWVAREYLKRASVKAAKLGSHTLRHSFAVELLRKGHSLRAIGEVLGHDHPQSTSVYAKAAVEQLRGVALDIAAVLP